MMRDATAIFSGVRHSRPARRLGAAGAALAMVAGLAGCAGGPAGSATLIYDVTVGSAYSPQEVAGAGGATALEMKGAPPDGADVAAVAAAMRMPPGFGSGGFAPATAQDVQGMRMLVIFNPSGRLRACEGVIEGDQGPGDDGRTLALIAWCDGPRELSSEMMRTGAQGPGDAGFAAAMSQALHQLLPQINPNVSPGENSLRRRR